MTWFGFCVLASLNLTGWMGLALWTEGRAAYWLGAVAFGTSWVIAVPTPLLIWYAQAGMLGT